MDNGTGTEAKTKAMLTAENAAAIITVIGAVFGIVFLVAAINGIWKENVRDWTLKRYLVEQCTAKGGVFWNGNRSTYESGCFRVTSIAIDSIIP